jgi:hypothetical protein
MSIYYFKISFLINMEISSQNFEKTTKVCGVLVEPRKTRNVLLLIDNFRKVLPNKILFFFCGSSHYSYYKSLFLNDPFIKIIDSGFDNFSATTHSDFLKKRSFWENFYDFTHVLTLQIDGCLCTKSKFKIEDFLHYDYIGGYTPKKWWWRDTHGLHNFSDYQCFNGGFSLRRIQCMLDIIDTFPPKPSKDWRISTRMSFRTYIEDLYFVVGMLIINSTKDKPIYKVALDEFATNFCTHTKYVKDTFCVHNLDKYSKNDELIEFLKYCPEFAYFTKIGLSF